MKWTSNAWKALCAVGVMLALVSVPAHAASIQFQLKDGISTVSNTDVTLYLSYGKEVAMTGADGKVAFEVSNAKGFWIEVNGRRLARFFQIGQVPQVIDIAAIGTMQWGGRR
jgi:hypothetical protein